MADLMNPNLNNPLLGLGLGLLSQPTMGRGLLAGYGLIQDAQNNAMGQQLAQLRLNANQQALDEQQRRAGLLKQFGQVMGQDRPPALLQRPDLPQFLQGQAMGLLGELDPGAAIGLLQPQRPQELTGDVRQFMDARQLGLIPPGMSFDTYLNSVKRPLVQNISIPSGYTMDPSNPGALIPIPGGPADPNTKPVTEDQAKAGGYADRAFLASQALDSLAGKYSPQALNTKRSAESIWGIGNLVTGPLANRALSPEDQQAEQAQRDFINAVLRRESGAVINDSEFDNARKQYFPQPGDSPEVIQQKARNRETTIQGIARAAGQKYKLPRVQDATSRPADVDAALWNAMTPEERALWQR